MNDMKLRTKSGRTIAVRNLRPGDWLCWDGSKKSNVLVAQNWPSIDRTELWFEGDRKRSAVIIWPHMPFDYTYVGRGKKREWLRRLPSFIRRHFCPYSKPTK